MRRGAGAGGEGRGRPQPLTSLRQQLATAATGPRRSGPPRPGERAPTRPSDPHRLTAAPGAAPLRPRPQLAFWHASAQSAKQELREMTERLGRAEVGGVL